VTWLKECGEWSLLTPANRPVSPPPDGVRGYDARGPRRPSGTVRMIAQIFGGSCGNRRQDEDRPIWPLDLLWVEEASIVDGGARGVAATTLRYRQGVAVGR